MSKGNFGFGLVCSAKDSYLQQVIFWKFHINGKYTMEQNWKGSESANFTADKVRFKEKP